MAFILREMLQGLDYLHSKRIAYGNMSTHNILFSIASGSLEIKLDHTHAVIDQLEARPLSKGTDIYNHIIVSIIVMSIIA